MTASCPAHDGLTSCRLTGVAGSVYDLAASPSLADLLKDVSAQVPDPDRKGKSLADVRSAEDDMEGAEAPTTPSDSLKVLNVAALGSGSGKSCASYPIGKSTEM